jgi:GcrA cell cycle regulator
MGAPHVKRTTALDMQFAALWRAGAPYDAIQATMDISRWTLMKWRKELDLMPRFSGWLVRPREAIERDRQLAQLWDEGHSTAEIGRRMGISKNAVIGRARRLDLPARPSPIKRDGYCPPRIKRAPRVTLANEYHGGAGGPCSSGMMPDHPKATQGEQEGRWRLPPTQPGSAAPAAPTPNDLPDSTGGPCASDRYRVPTSGQTERAEAESGQNRGTATPAAPQVATQRKPPPSPSEGSAAAVGQGALPPVPQRIVPSLPRAKSCIWTTGSRGAWVCCEAPALRGSLFCLEHHQRGTVGDVAASHRAAAHRAGAAA